MAVDRGKHMSSQFFFYAIGLLVLGLCLFAVSDKERQASGEWSAALQWGYLCIMIGVFGMLAAVINFTAVLLLFTLLTGAIWVWYKLNRHKYDPRRGIEAHHFVDYMSGFFPIILVVFLLRSFVAEPFVIPSSSMRPGLVVGDFVLVNKFAYGLRLPILNNVVVPTGHIQNGDVVVFNYPKDPSINFIKRIVGVPGDVVEYKNKVLTINGRVATDEFVRNTSFMAEADEKNHQPPHEVAVKEFNETLGGRQFPIFQIAENPVYDSTQVEAFDGKENCQYVRNGFKCKVPPDKYFAMGDDRDFSLDSRYWGFVDDKLIVGKATYIWMNLKDFKRIGTKIP